MNKNLEDETPPTLANESREKFVNILELETHPGQDIQDACKRATRLARSKKKAVVFNFNDKRIVCNPGDGWRDALRKWDADYDPAKAGSGRSSTFGKTTAQPQTRKDQTWNHFSSYS